MKYVAKHWKSVVTSAQKSKSCHKLKIEWSSKRILKVRSSKDGFRLEDLLIRMGFFLLGLKKLKILHMHD